MNKKYKKSQKILIVANCTWYLYNFRRELLEELKNNGYELILLSPKDEFFYFIEKYFIKSENLFLKRGSENPILELFTIFHMLYIYRKYNPILVHHFTIKPCIYGGIIANFLGIKAVINHITGLGPSFFTPRRKIRIINYILHPFYKYSFNNENAMNIFHNESDRETLVKKKLTNSTKTILIKGSGVNTEYFKNNTDKTSYSKKVQLLFPARLIKEKGIMELLFVCNELWDENYKFTLNIAGEIDQQNHSSLNNENKFFLFNHENINFIGKSFDMLSIYKNTDIVVLPSWREGLSKSLLEAGSMSLPIITTDVPGCRDVIENNKSGILVPLKNTKKLKLAIKFLLENESIALNYGKNSRKVIMKNFTVEKINNQIIKLYEKLIKR